MIKATKPQPMAPHQPCPPQEVKGHYKYLVLRLRKKVWVYHVQNGILWAIAPRNIVGNEKTLARFDENIFATPAFDRTGITRSTFL